MIDRAAIRSSFILSTFNIWTYGIFSLNLSLNLCTRLLVELYDFANGFTGQLRVNVLFTGIAFPFAEELVLAWVAGDGIDDELYYTLFRFRTAPGIIDVDLDHYALYHVFVGLNVIQHGYRDDCAHQVIRIERAFVTQICAYLGDYGIG